MSMSNKYAPSLLPQYICFQLLLTSNSELATGPPIRRRYDSCASSASHLKSPRTMQCIYKTWSWSLACLVVSSCLPTTELRFFFLAILSRLTKIAAKACNTYNKKNVCWQVSSILQAKDISFSASLPMIKSLNLWGSDLQTHGTSIMLLHHISEALMFKRSTFKHLVKNLALLLWAALSQYDLGTYINRLDLYLFKIGLQLSNMTCANFRESILCCHFFAYFNGPWCAV